MAILKEEIIIDLQPYSKTNARYPVVACSYFAEHLDDGDLGNLNHTTDYALRIVERNLIRHRVFGDLESGAGAGHDLGECKIYGPRQLPGDTAQPAHQQDSTGQQNSRASRVVLMRKKKEKNILMKIEEQLMERSRLMDTDTVKVRKKELGLQFLYKRKNPKANLGQVCGRIQWDTGRACTQPIYKRCWKCHTQR